MNVRELVTVLKFKTDSASLKSAENAVNRIKSIMQRTKPLNLKVNTGNAQKSVNALTSKLNQLQQNKRVRINVDTSQIDKATQSLNRLSQAQVRASQAHFKGKAQGLAQGKTQEKISLALIEEAIKGNVKAFEVIRDTIGEKPVTKQEIEGVSGMNVIINREAVHVESNN